MEDLNKLAKRIASIEEKDANFKDNPTWQKLRYRQDVAYIELAKEKLEFHKKEFLVRKRDWDKEKIKFYEEYVEKNEKEIPENENHKI